LLAAPEHCIKGDVVRVQLECPPHARAPRHLLGGRRVRRVRNVRSVSRVSRLSRVSRVAGAVGLVRSVR
jgi:hypothetical protein